jgi:nucleotide-binding universal stress UspA family protein
MFRNILVAVDGSPDADAALGYAVELCGCAGGQLTILVAAAEPSHIALLAPDSATNVRKLAFTRAGQIAARAREYVADRAPAKYVVTREPVRPAVNRQILDGRHDLVVIGSRGRPTLKAELGGSVSHYVLYHSTIPVLVVRAVRGLPRTGAC